MVCNGLYFLLNLCGAMGLRDVLLSFVLMPNEAGMVVGRKQNMFGWHFFKEKR